MDSSGIRQLLSIVRDKRPDRTDVICTLNMILDDDFRNSMCQRLENPRQMTATEMFEMMLARDDSFYNFVLEMV